MFERGDDDNFVLISNILILEQDISKHVEELDFDNIDVMEYNIITILNHAMWISNICTVND